MKEVLRSVKPYWLYLILTGKKTVEIGKSCPQAKDWNKVVEMYCSKDMRSFNRIPEEDKEWMRKYLGKVIGEFVCDKIEEFSVGSLRSDDIENLACLSYSEMIDYFYKPKELDGKTAKHGYAWHISDLKIYNKPKELSEFKKPLDSVHCSYYGDYCEEGCVGFGGTDYYCKDYWDWEKGLTRPPQSWCYVQE